MKKIINDYEIKEIVLNPMYLINFGYFEFLESKGLPVRWKEEDEDNNEIKFQLVIDEDQMKRKLGWRQEYVELSI